MIHVRSRFPQVSKHYNIETAVPIRRLSTPQTFARFPSTTQHSHTREHNTSESLRYRRKQKCLGRGSRDAWRAPKTFLLSALQRLGDRWFGSRRETGGERALENSAWVSAVGGKKGETRHTAAAWGLKNGGTGRSEGGGIKRRGDRGGFSRAHAPARKGSWGGEGNGAKN